MPTAEVEPITVYQGEPGETIRIAELPLAGIRIPDFQRERKAHHAKIAGEFDRTAYAFPEVIEFEGDYFSADGQQRLAALELRGEESATVLLISGVASTKRAAQIYLLVNRDRKNLNAFEKFVGAHAAHDVGTREIAKILSEHELRVGKSAGAPDHIPAGAATSIYNTYGGDILARVLFIREVAWGAENAPESRESKTLRGLAKFLKCWYDQISDDHLADVLRRHHPSSILSKVEGNVRRGTFDARYSDYVKHLYDRSAAGKRNVRRLPR